MQLLHGPVQAVLSAIDSTSDQLVQESTEANCRFNVIQPGSSVATALSEGESKKKHVVLLEILGEQYRTINMPLITVRPFAHESVSTP